MSENMNLLAAALRIVSRKEPNQIESEALNNFANLAWTLNGQSKEKKQWFASLAISAISSDTMKTIYASPDMADFFISLGIPQHNGMAMSGTRLATDILSEATLKLEKPTVSTTAQKSLISKLISLTNMSTIGKLLWQGKNNQYIDSMPSLTEVGEAIHKKLPQLHQPKETAAPTKIAKLGS